MAPCIIDFIGANALIGPVGGRGPWTLLSRNSTRFARCHLRAQECPCVMLLMRAASIMRASGRGLGPGNRDFFRPCEMASSIESISSSSIPLHCQGKPTFLQDEPPWHWGDFSQIFVIELFYYNSMTYCFLFPCICRFNGVLLCHPLWGFSLLSGHFVNSKSGVQECGLPWRSDD